MKLRISTVVLIGLLLAPAGTALARPRPVQKLTPAGQRLMRQYAEMLHNLQVRIVRALPAINARRRRDFMAAFRAQSARKPYINRNKAYIKAIAACRQSARPILTAINSFIAGKEHDAELIKASVLAGATPKGLAFFAQRSHADALLIDHLLADPALMRQMQKADGPRDGNYGLTMRIYTAIEQTGPLARSGIFQRLAMGTALNQRSHIKLRGDAAYNPVTRYLNYQKASMAGELNPAFPTFTTWDCRLITDDPFSNREITWFRQMLQNYEPDYIFSSHYLNIVHTEVGYCHPHWGIVPGSLAAQIIAGGGECGPRAWIGRLAERAFGIPTWGVRQRGHAALSHWTPQGWITRLGAGFEWNWWDHRRGPDFYLESQARRYPGQFMTVLRLRWIGAATGEAKPNGMIPGTGGFWYALADMQEQAIVASGRPPASPTAAELARRFGPTKAQIIEMRPVSQSSLETTINARGVIHVPAVACGLQFKSRPGVIFSKSFLGGMQLRYCHLRRGLPRPLLYRITAVRPGRYLLSGKIVTVKPTQHLMVQVNRGPKPVDMTVPWTDGMWQRTRPVGVTLRRGTNVIKLSPGAGFFAVSIKSFTLSPVGSRAK